jgi:predicted transcriptional regulator
MKALTLYSMDLIDELSSPASPLDISLESPAIEFFTDFQTVQPLVIEPSELAIESKKIMIKTHVRLHFVVDEKGHFVGVISADDLAERKIMQKVASGVQRDEVFVSDLMIPKKNLLALNIDEVKKSRISDIINLLKNQRQQHCLVIDQDAQKIRGIFSSSDISRQLKLPIDIQEESNFFRVFSAVG